MSQKDRKTYIIYHTTEDKLKSYTQEGKEVTTLGRDHFHGVIYKIDFVEFQGRKFIIAAHEDENNEKYSKLKLLSFPELAVVNKNFANCPKIINCIKVSDDQ